MSGRGEEAINLVGGGEGDLKTRDKSSSSGSGRREGEREREVHFTEALLWDSECFTTLPSPRGLAKFAEAFSTFFFSLSPSLFSFTQLIC